MQVARALGHELIFNACSGAKAMSDSLHAVLVNPGSSTDDVDRQLRAEATRNSIYGQLLRWERDPAVSAHEPSLLLLSLGGNDAGFSKIGAACFMPGSCGAVLEAVAEEGDDDSEPGRLAAVDTRVTETLRKAVEVFPEIPMVVVAYPQMFGGRTERCGGQVPFAGDEIDALRRLVPGLNAEVAAGIEGVIAAVGDLTDEDGSVTARRITHFRAVEAAFGPERFCEIDPETDLLVDPAAMNRLRLNPSEGVDLLARLIPSKLIHNTFHPTVRGHDLMALALEPFLEERCWEIEKSDLPACEAGLGPSVGPAVPAGGPSSSPEELVALAGVLSNFGCDDLESFVRCAIVRSVRSVLWPVVLLVLGGVYLALAGRGLDLPARSVGWLRNLPVVGDRLARVLPVVTK